MGTPLAPLDLKPNDKINEKFIVKKKLGEGACGQVFLVGTLNAQGKTCGRAAVKVEPRMKCKDDEILKMEIYVLKKLQKSRHVCKLLANGMTSNYTYVVMSLLGMELADLRKKCPNRRFSHPTVLRIGIQVLTALKDVHEAGFVHRDVKPSNLAMGFTNPLVLYVFDFGLARQILVDDGKGSLKLRDERPRVMFRGTVRYCSLNVHNFKEQGRHDDLIAAMNSLIECTSVLPWRGHIRKEAAKMKQNTADSELCKECPPSFLAVYKSLKKLKYTDVPPYIEYGGMFKSDLPKGIKMTEPYEWTKKGAVVEEADGPKSNRERAELDKDPTIDQQTVNDVNESVVTDDDKESKGGNDGEFPANDDTMDGM